MDNQDKPKGFEGLSKLVSDLSDLSKPEPPVERTGPHSASSERKTTSTPAQSASSKPENKKQESAPNPDGTLGAGGALMIGFVVLLIIGALVANNESEQFDTEAGSEGQSSSASVLVDQNSQKQDVSDSSSESKKIPGNTQSQSSTQYSDEPVKAQIFSTKKPPVGTNHVHSISEIRWCLAQDIRIDAVRSFNETQADVAEFNRWVDDWNSRCGSYRYRQGNLSSAKRDVEPHRSEIRDAAREAVAAERQQKTASLTMKIQLALQSLGYKPGPADGIYGTNTAEAIKRYQRENSLLVSGQVSEELLEQLKFSKAIR